MTAGPRRPSVVVTRADAPDEAFERTLGARGIAVEWLRTVAILPPANPARLDAALARLGTYDWLAFTSAHAVDAVVRHPYWADARRNAPAGRARLAAVGPSTSARLAAAGYPADLEAPDAGGASLAAALAAGCGGSLCGVRILWPASNIARREFAERVAAAGGDLTEVTAYRCVPDPSPRMSALAAGVAAGSVDAVAFFSPSAASSLAAALGTGTLAALAGRTLVASLGPTTSAALRRLGAPPDVEAQPHTALALAEILASRLGL